MLKKVWEENDVYRVHRLIATTNIQYMHNLRISGKVLET